MKPIRRDLSRYHFPPRDQAEDIPKRILRLAKRSEKIMRKCARTGSAKHADAQELVREMYRCAFLAQEHVFGMGDRLRVQERIAEKTMFKHQAEVFEAEREAVHGFVSEAISDSFDPHGYFVYLLWGGPHLQSPLYVGMSTNIFGRLGTHLYDKRKHSYVTSVQLIRCESEPVMRKLELKLIRKYRPAWNIKGVERGSAPRLRYS